MKVETKRTSGITVALAAISAVAIITATLAGAGIVPPRTASAQVVERDSDDHSLPLSSLPAAQAQPKADEIRQPSGLDVAETQAAGTRTRTVIRRATPVVRAPRVSPPSSTVAATSDGWQSARASWYGPGFYGHGMAGGGTLQPDSMVVAHRSLPFGTVIEFAYNGNTCTAVVMDRGPFTGGRTFDLGPGTAAALGFSGVGTVQYRIVS